MALFRKKEQDALPDMSMDFGSLPQIPELPPLSPSMSQPQLRDLTSRGFTSADVLAGMQASQMRPAGPQFQQNQQSQFQQLPPMPAPPVFRPSAPSMPSGKSTTEEIEEIAEAIISERWQKFSRDFDEIKRSQEDISATISGMQEKISNLEKRMDMVIQEILGKVDEYGKGISDVGTELKAMQKVFGTVLPSFTENIKELQELVGEAKEKGFKKTKAKRKR